MTNTLTVNCINSQQLLLWLWSYLWRLLLDKLVTLHPDPLAVFVLCGAFLCAADPWDHLSVKQSRWCRDSTKLGFLPAALFSVHARVWKQLGVFLLIWNAMQNASYPLRLRIFQGKKLSVFLQIMIQRVGISWKSRLHIKTGVVIPTECTLSVFFLTMYLSVHIQYIYNICTHISLTHTHTPACPPTAAWLERWNTTSFLFRQSCWTSSAVRRRKRSCQRRDREAGCWRFICSGGTAEVARVKLLHLLTTTVNLNKLFKWDKETLSEICTVISL